jgi:prepilin-type N-terminal cleavage/methylation domain-containing protein
VLIGAGVRRGFTLFETLVAMIVAALMLTLCAAILLRQHRVFADLGERDALDSQLEEAALVLPIDVRGASPADGDIREARDTALELRSTIGSAVVCDVSGSSYVLPPVSAGPTAFSSFSASADVGDSVWVFSGDPADTWSASRVTSVGSAHSGACAAAGPVLSGTALTAPRSLITVTPAPLANVIGMPLRITRPVRYSLYHASDGGWYLGERDWNSGTSRFNTIQPIAGPFLSPSSAGLLLQYADTAGVLLATPVANTRIIAQVRASFRGQTLNPVRILALGRTSGRRTDSLSITTATWNHR